MIEDWTVTDDDYRVGRFAPAIFPKDDPFFPRFKQREDVVKYIGEQLACDSADYTQPEDSYRQHYGRCQLRSLMDFIYDGKPKGESELIPSDEYPLK